MASYAVSLGAGMAKRFIKAAFQGLRPLFKLLSAAETAIAERWMTAAYRRLHFLEWRQPPMPEFFKHKIDLYWQWQAKQNSFWVERGVYSRLAIKPGAVILELCCGDGFNSYFFYSSQAERVIAIDFDTKAIAYAKRNFAAANLTYHLADIRTQMPPGDFDNIVWDAAIEHFTEAEIAQIMGGIKSRLAKATGILSGYTLVARDDGQKHLEQHECEFKSKEDLFRFLSPFFRNVAVFEVPSAERHNLYFWASDGVIPFDPAWGQVVRSQHPMPVG
jgi:hypothetical protein